MTAPFAELCDLLHSIIDDEAMRPVAIVEFQKRVFGASEGKFGQYDETLRELAYDLDFFEPDPRVRASDISFFGTDRLVSEIAAVLRRLEDGQPTG